MTHFFTRVDKPKYNLKYCIFFGSVRFALFSLSLKKGTLFKTVGLALQNPNGKR